MQALWIWRDHGAFYLSGQVRQLPGAAAQTRLAMGKPDIERSQNL